MTKEKHFTLLATIESQDHVILHLSYPHVRFTTSAEGYGNKTYLHIESDWMYDIRYDGNYHPGREVAYLAAWAGNYWNGRNGAWTLIGLQISGKAEE